MSFDPYTGKPIEPANQTPQGTPPAPQPYGAPASSQPATQNPYSHQPPTSQPAPPNLQKQPMAVAPSAPTAPAYHAPAAPYAGQHGVVPYSPVAHPAVRDLPAGVPVYEFRGDAGSFFGVYLLSYLIMFFTAGILTPFAICMIEKWRAENTYLMGRQQRFVGTGGALFGPFILWYLLCLVTVGIYVFWMVPKLQAWLTRHTLLV